MTLLLQRVSSQDILEGVPDAVESHGPLHGSYEPADGPHNVEHQVLWQERKNLVANKSVFEFSDPPFTLIPRLMVGEIPRLKGLAVGFPWREDQLVRIPAPQSHEASSLAQMSQRYWFKSHRSLVFSPLYIY